MTEFKIGQNVLYYGKETHVENIYEDGTFLIANPYWDFDEEALYVTQDANYDTPYWIFVKGSDLTPI